MEFARPRPPLVEWWSDQWSSGLQVPVAGLWLEASRAWLLYHLQDLHRYCRHMQHNDTYPFLPVHANQKRSRFREADFRMALLQRLNSASMSASCTFWCSWSILMHIQATQ